MREWIGDIADFIVMVALVVIFAALATVLVEGFSI